MENPTFSPPRWRAIRWLATSETGGSEEIGRAVFDTLFGNVTMFLGGALNVALIAAIVAWRHPELVFIGWLAFNIALAAVRIVVQFVGTARALAGRPTPTDLHVGLMLVWAASVGFGAFAIALTGNWQSTLLVWTSVAAMAGGIGFSNFGAPRVAMAMLALALGPLCASIPFLRDPVMWIMLGQTLFFCLSLYLALQSLHGLLVKSMRAELDSSHRARHDPLTGLANRAGLDHFVATAWPTGGAATKAVFCLDLDGFKPVNDTYGHHAGDALLTRVAQRLREAVLPATDGGPTPDRFIARLGGDEFVVVAAVASPTDARALGDRIVALVAEPYVFDSQLKVTIGVSVGAGVGAGPAAFADVLRQADAALYRAKEHGGNVVCLHTAAGEVDTVMRNAPVSRPARMMTMTGTG